MTDARLVSNYHISELFCRENTASVRALATIVVVLCHLGGVMDKTPLNPIYVFTPFGYLAVALFFFFSGYNLYVSCIERPERWKDGFWKKKFFRVILPFFIANLLYELYSFAIGSPWGGLGALLLGVLGVRLKNITLWYIRSILLLYLLCWVCFLPCALFRRAEGRRLYLTAGAVPVMLVYGLAASRFSVFPHFTVVFPLPFLMGALTALWGEAVLPFWVRNRERLIFALGFLLLYCVIYAADGELQLFIGPLELYMTCATAVLPLLTMTILIGKQVSVPFLNFVDRYSLEMYLLHAMCFRLYKSLVFIDNHYLYLAAYLGTLTLLAVGLGKFCALCRRGFDALTSGGQTAA